MVFRVPGREPLLFGFVETARRNALLLSSSLGKASRLCLTILDPDNRAHRGKAKIKARLIADLDSDEWELPPKPKWMRWRTYNRYEERFDQYEAILEDGIEELITKLLTK